MKIPEMQVIDTEYGEEEMNVYANTEDMNTYDDCMMSGTENFDTKRKQTSQHTGSERVMNRRYRSVTVCLVLLCVLLLIVVIVMSVLNNTNNQQFDIKTKNLTEERDQLLTKYTKLTEERDQLLTKNTNLTEERKQLQTKYTSITEERDQLQTKYTSITKERDQLLSESANLITKIDILLTNNNNLNNQREQLTQLINTTIEILKADGWIYYQSSLYFNSSEERSWYDSRRYCREREADLIIINNKEEQDFITKNFGEDAHWIGLADSDDMVRWESVTGSPTNSTMFWETGKPNYQTKDNCALSYSFGWRVSCYSLKKLICERNISISL